MLNNGRGGGGSGGVRGPCRRRRRRGRRVYQVLCVNTESCANAGGEIRGDLHHGVPVASALSPQAYEGLPEVVVEVVGSGGVGDEDCKSRAFEFTALELLEPRRQDLAASKGDETFDESMPLGLRSRIWSAKFFGCGLLRTTGEVSTLYRRIKILLDGNVVLVHNFLARWARGLGPSARCCGKARSWQLSLKFRVWHFGQFVAFFYRPA